MAKIANDKYQQFNGTDHYYKHWLGFTYTDGVAQIAEDYGAHWFLDVIASYQCHHKVRCQLHQTWILKRVKDDTFMVTCEDGNHNKVTSQKIEFSDFKDDLLTIWMINRVMLLPSEY